ncbi:MAG TPA: hypothetical protein VIX62_05905 [Actinomycetota bacterium]
MTEAVASADDIGMRFESVVARRLLASALRVRGDIGEAAQVVEEALVIARCRGYTREVRLLSDLIEV